MSRSMLNSLAGALREAGMNYDNRVDDPNFYKYLVKAVLERMKEIKPEIIKIADSCASDGRGSEDAWKHIIELIIEEK